MNLRDRLDRIERRLRPGRHLPVIVVKHEDEDRPATVVTINEGRQKFASMAEAREWLDTR